MDLPSTRRASGSEPCGRKLERRSGRGGIGEATTPSGQGQGSDPPDRFGRVDKTRLLVLAGRYYKSLRNCRERMRVTQARVREERTWVRERADVIVPQINAVRADLGDAFETTVDQVSEREYREAVDEVFADGDVGVNVAAFVALLRDLDVTEDYPGFVVDEYLGRRLAATIAGGEPLSLLSQATFHYADITVRERGPAGADDLDAALAAGFQTRLPGWEWTEGPSPFSVG